MTALQAHFVHPIDVYHQDDEEYGIDYQPSEEHSFFAHVGTFGLHIATRFSYTGCKVTANFLDLTISNVHDRAQTCVR